jgi:hypothetical protein
LIITPVPRFDQWQNACSVRARLGAEDAGSRSPLITVSGKIILHVLPDEVQVIRLIALGHQADGVVQHRYDMWECVAEET